MVERVTLIGVTYVDERGHRDTMVPLRCDDGTWFVLDSEGCSYWADPEAVEEFAGEAEEDAGEADDAYRLLAQIMREAADV